MDLQTHFDVLSVVLERYESEGRTVRRVETESLAGAGLRATMDVTVPLEGAGGPTPSTTLSGDGTLRLMIPDAGLPTPPEDVAAAVTTAPNGARITDDGTVVVSVALAVDASEEAPGDDDVRSETGDPDANIRGDGAGVATDDDGDSTGLAAVRDESVPPYEDTPYLRALYEVCDTFAEMSREIPMDVSSETVRRYMIEAGVHDPDSYDGDSGADSADEDRTTGTDESDSDTAVANAAEDATDPIDGIPDEQLIADGIGLPANLTIEDVADAVVGSSTMYSVHRRLGIEQDRARELLRELNLLDLVLHRINSRPQADPSYEEVAARIRQCTPEDV